MKRPDLPESEAEDPRGELRAYRVGVVLALVLTACAFGIVAYDLLETAHALGVLGLLAVVQTVVHFRFFMHIDLKRSHRDDLQLILFTAIIVFLMTAGTIWVMWNLNARMG